MTEPVDLDALERLAIRAKADGDWLSEGTPDPDAMLALIQRVREAERNVIRLTLMDGHAENMIVAKDADIARLTERVRELEEAGQQVVDEWERQHPPQ